jgi:hypothetical protein
MKKVLFFALIAFFASCSNDDESEELNVFSPSLLWNYEISERTTIRKNPHTITSTTDNGVFVLMDSSVVKYDENGNATDNLTFGYKLQLIHRSESNDYLLVGRSDTNIFISKLDESLNQSWQKDYFIGNDTEASVIEEIGNEFIIGGSISTNAWLMKIDTDGNQVWSKEFDEFSKEKIRKIRKTSTNEILIVGEALPETVTDTDSLTDALVLKLDVNGTIIWQNIFGTDRTNSVIGIEEGSNGNYFLVREDLFKRLDNGPSFNLVSDHFQLIEITPNGEISKSTQLENHERINAFEKFGDDFLIIGTNTSSIGTAVIKINQNGKKVWQLISNVYREVGSAVTTTTDGGKVILANDFYKYRLFKIAAE